MRELNKPTFWILLGIIVLNLLVAIGNWQLYDRVKRLEIAEQSKQQQ